MHRMVGPLVHLLVFPTGQQRGVAYHRLKDEGEVAVVKAAAEDAT